MKTGKTLIAVALVLILASIANAYDEVSYGYIFPISAKGNGQAGTRWLTELCVTNPWPGMVRIDIGVNNNGATFASGYAEIPGYETWCWPDIYEALGIGNNSGIMAVASSQQYVFSAAMRIYNTAPGGFFGQNVMPVASPDGISHPGQAVDLPGLRNSGAPGSSGARTNVGIANVDSSSVDVTILECGGNGNCSNRTMTIGPKTVRQVSVNRSFDEGHVVISGDGGIIAYASVVDNRSGDASFRPHFLDSWGASNKDENSDQHAKQMFADLLAMSPSTPIDRPN